MILTEITMLRNKSRRAAATKKQASLMADQRPHNPSTASYHSSSLFSSPKFRFFTSKMTPFDPDLSLVSPTSTLEANPSIFSSKNPKTTTCYLEPTVPNPPRSHFHPPDAFGLADLVENSRKPVNNKMVLFGSKLRVQIPCADFGTKTVAQGMRYPAHAPCLQTKVLAVSQIDQTEDYTRVISHGPNPTITHIFDNSVFVEATPSSLPSPPLPMDSQNTHNFLSFCYTCKKNLGQKQDIYIYRGEKGFCSSDCRNQEMLLDQMET